MYGTWATPDSGEVLSTAGIQTSATYVCLGQKTVDQWVDIRNISKVCAWEKRFKGGGRRRRPWW